LRFQSIGTLSHLLPTPLHSGVASEKRGSDGRVDSFGVIAPKTNTKRVCHAQRHARPTTLNDGSFILVPVFSISVPAVAALRRTKASEPGGTRIFQNVVKTFLQNVLKVSCWLFRS